MSVISGGVDSKYVLLDGQERNIERSLSEIENKDITLTNGFLIETVGNSKLDDTGNTSGTTNESDVVSVVGLVDLGVVEDLLNGLESGAKEVLDTVRVRVEGGRRYCLVRQFHVGHSMT